MVQFKLNGALKHGKGGVTRCPAMMSSIGALCGSQACHSFIPPGVCFCVSMCVCVCCWSHPTTKAIAFCSSMRHEIGRWRLTHKHKKSPRLFQPWLCYSSTEEFCLRLLKNLRSPSITLTQHTFILTHTLWSAHTPWKIPKPLTSAQYTSPLPLACFYKVKHSPDEGKNTWSS